MYAWKLLYYPFKFLVSICRNGEADENNVVSLEAIFSEDEYDMLEDDSDSDGYISEVFYGVLPILFMITLLDWVHSISNVICELGTKLF